MADFFDPTPEQQKVVLVDAATLREVERLIESCEHCNVEHAEIPFDNILESLNRLRSERDVYILEEPPECPNCRREILEKTLVEPVHADRKTA